MRKFSLLSAAFIFVFGLTFGISMTLTEDAMAEEPCPTACCYDYYCSYETGENCSGPFAHHYSYRYNGVCPGYPTRACPADGFNGCCGLPGMWIYCVLER